MQQQSKQIMQFYSANPKPNPPVSNSLVSMAMQPDRYRSARTKFI